MVVREDAIRRADGSAGIYGVVSKPDFALVIPSDGDALYLVEQYRYAVAAHTLEFPQGTWEHQPAVSPAELAAAELAEETGLRAGRMTYLGRALTAPGYSDQGMHVFLAEDLTPGPSALSPEEQGLRSVRLSVARFRELARTGGIRDAATLAAYALLQLGARA
jgi:8-oxo-dGTP pyrophosphatase MutT (NUDIX family)